MADDTTTAPRPGRITRARRTFLGWPLPARVASYVALGVVLALVVGLVAAVTVARRPLPVAGGAEVLPGLTGSVEVVRDEHGVPQVWADTTEDLMRAQGWVTASERFFQMDVRRHVAEGRLAELFGADAVPSDRLARTLGWARTARAELALVEPETRTALAAYAEGVNAYLDRHGTADLAVEYSLLGLGGVGYAPEPWSETDSLAWLKTVAWEVGGDLDAEVDRALTTAAVGEAVVDDLFPSTSVADPVVDQGAVVDGVFEQDAVTGGTRNPLRPPYEALDRPATGPAALGVLRRTGEALDALPSWVARGAGRGSNAWVVDGEHSETGAPLLANDPHLDASLPGVWMQVGLHCREVSAACPYDVAGSSLPGVPGVVVGHNAEVAWGITSLGADVTDLFVEKMAGDTYRYEGESLPLRVRRERIQVAGGEAVEIEVRSTRHGPLLSEALDPVADVAEQAPGASGLEVGADEAVAEHAVAVRWTGLEPSTTADAVLALDRAGSWGQFRAAAARFALPALGLVYADSDGHVGFQAAGDVPVRKSGNDGALPVAGWRSETDWTGRTVPADGLPSVLDPEDGVLVAANQAVADSRYPALLTTTPDPGYRAARITEVLDGALAADGRVSPQDLAELQGDDLHPLAGRLVPLLLDIDLPQDYPSDGQRLLATWDGRQSADSGAAAYFNAVWRSLLARTFHDELPVALRPDGGARWVAVVDRLLDRPASPWWDDLGTDDAIESRDDVLRAALLEARDDLTSRQAFDADEWAWGRGHVLELEAGTGPLWGSDAVRRFLDRTGPPTGGSGVSVDATGWDAAAPDDEPTDDPWAVTTAPSMRMVVDLGDLDASGWVSLAGVSGHPTSEHYDDQLEAWTAGELLAWPFSREAVDAAATDTLVLEPPEE